MEERERERRPMECPECGSEELYGPVSDYWGICCVDCGHEVVSEDEYVNGEVGENGWTQTARRQLEEEN